jgi:hypothetical protein
MSILVDSSPTREAKALLGSSERKLGEIGEAVSERVDSIYEDPDSHDMEIVSLGNNMDFIGSKEQDGTGFLVLGADTLTKDDDKLFLTTAGEPPLEVPTKGKGVYKDINLYESKNY